MIRVQNTTQPNTQFETQNKLEMMSRVHKEYVNFVPDVANVVLLTPVGIR